MIVESTYLLHDIVRHRAAAKSADSLTTRTGKADFGEKICPVGQGSSPGLDGIIRQNIGLSREELDLVEVKGLLGRQTVVVEIVFDSFELEEGLF